MFKAVVDYGGFNQAADVIHKSQSSIHHAVQKLETVLGVQLLEVKGRRVQLTSSGELMLRRANYLLEEAAKLEAIATNLSGGVESYLRVAIDAIFPPLLLYQVFESVSAQFPYLRIECFETILSGSNELLQAGSVELSITPFPIQSLFNEPLCAISFLSVAHYQHALHQLGRDLTFEDLKSHRQIVVRDSAQSQNQCSGWLGADQRWMVSNLQTSVDLVSRGFGFAWLPETIIQPLLDNKTLVPLRMRQGGKRKTQLYLQFEDADQLGPAARCFMGELRHRSMSMSE